MTRGIENDIDKLPDFDDPTPEHPPLDEVWRGPELSGFCGACRTRIKLHSDYGPYDIDNAKAFIGKCPECAKSVYIGVQALDGDLYSAYSANITFAMGLPWVCWDDAGICHAVDVWWDQLFDSDKPRMHVLMACHYEVTPWDVDEDFTRRKDGFARGIVSPLTCFQCIAEITRRPEGVHGS
jgi:hypothetical protein